MKILHFSDIHVDFSPQRIPIRQWFGKRFVGGVNHVLRRSRRFRRTKEKLAALANFAADQSVDLVICTGDYTILGTENELGAARAAVEPLTNRPLGYITVPGNHDVYLNDSVLERRFDRHFAEFLESDRPDLAALDGWPKVRLFDDVAVIAVRSARPNPLVWLSSGMVETAELRGLERALLDPEIARRFVIVASHYALRGADGRPDSVSHGLDNADDVLRAISEISSGCYLHGHIHRRFQLRLPGVRPTILGAGSATQEGSEGFWLIEIEGGHGSATPGYFMDEEYRLEGVSIPLS